MNSIPLSVRWIKRLLLFRLILMIVIFAAIALVLFFKPSINWLTTIVHLVLKSTGNGKTAEMDNPVFVLSYIFGFYMFNFLFISLEYYFLLKRKVIGFWVGFGLDVLSTLALRRLPFISLVVLILGTTKTARAFFKGSANEPVPLNILDDDAIH